MTKLYPLEFRKTKTKGWIMADLKTGKRFNLLWLRRCSKRDEAGRDFLGEVWQRHFSLSV